MLANKLLEILDQWDINKSKILIVVTDNGSNMIKAVKLANERQLTECINEEDDNGEDANNTEESNDENNGENNENTDDEETDEDAEYDVQANADVLNLHRFPCIAHALQLVIKELGKSQSYCNLIAKVKDLVRFVKISSVAQEKLTALCGKSVVKDCAMRWNSILLMIGRVLAIRGHLEQVLKELKHDSVCGDLTAGKRNRLTKTLEMRVFGKVNMKYYS